MKVLYVFLLAMPLITVDAYSQVIRLSRAAIDSIMNPPLYESEGEILIFEQKSEDIGAVYDTDSLQIVHFNFKNNTDRSVTICRVTTSCGCVTAAFPEHPVAAGSTGEISVTFNPRGKDGTFESNLFVYTDLSDKLPVSKLSVYANVLAGDEWDYLPQKMGHLRLKHKEVCFSDVEAGNSYTERILCANSGVRPLRLVATILPSYVEFDVEPEIIGPGEEGDIKITVDTSKLPQEVGDTLRFGILVGGIEGIPSKRTIKGIIDLKNSKK